MGDLEGAGRRGPHPLSPQDTFERDQLVGLTNVICIRDKSDGLYVKYLKDNMKYRIVQCTFPLDFFTNKFYFHTK